MSLFIWFVEDESERAFAPAEQGRDADGLQTMRVLIDDTVIGDHLAEDEFAFEEVEQAHD